MRWSAGWERPLHLHFGACWRAPPRPVPRHNLNIHVFAWPRRNLSADANGNQFRVAVGILHRLNRVFRGESSHHESQLAVGCGLDRRLIDPQDVLRSVGTAAVYLNDKLDVFHVSLLFPDWLGLSLLPT